MSNFHRAPTHDHWPRLSETLPYREPGRCASCGLREIPPEVDPGVDEYVRRRAYALHKWQLDIWRECDWQDKPENRFVVLCRSCADKLIEPHPRLYARLGYGGHEPAPGAMPLCLDCCHRDGTRCTSPMLGSNGGLGIGIGGPSPTRAHFLRRGKGARSGWETIYTLPRERCTGKEVAS